MFGENTVITTVVGGEGLRTTRIFTDSGIIIVSLIVAWTTIYIYIYIL